MSSIEQKPEASAQSRGALGSSKLACAQMMEEFEAELEALEKQPASRK